MYGRKLCRYIRKLYFFGEFLVNWRASNKQSLLLKTLFSNEPLVGCWNLNHHQHTTTYLLTYHCHLQNIEGELVNTFNTWHQSQSTPSCLNQVLDEYTFNISKWILKKPKLVGLCGLLRQEVLTAMAILITV